MLGMDGDDNTLTLYVPSNKYDTHKCLLLCSISTILSGTQFNVCVRKTKIRTQMKGKPRNANTIPMCVYICDEFVDETKCKYTVCFWFSSYQQLNKFSSHRFSYIKCVDQLRSIVLINKRFYCSNGTDLNWKVVNCITLEFLFQVIQCIK